MNDTTQNFAPTPTTSSATLKLYRPAEIARLGNRHPSTVKAIGDVLFPNALRLTDGSRLYSEREKDKILAEIQRRELEGFKR